MKLDEMKLIRELTFVKDDPLMLIVGKAPVRGRWLSVEESAEGILSILDIQAPNSLVQMAQEI